MLKRALLYVFVMLILLALAVSAGQWDKDTALLEQHAAEISSWIAQQESEAQNGTGLATIITHRGDSVISWSNTQVIPANSDLKGLSAQTGRALLKLPHGWFAVNTSSNGNTQSSTFVPIRYELNFNALADRHPFPANASISSNVHISESKTDYPILSGGKAIGWLDAKGPVHSIRLQRLKLCAWLLFFVVLFALLAQTARVLGAKYGWLSGASLVAFVASGLLWYNLQYGCTSEQFGALALFEPVFDHASLLGKSVGDWLIHAAVLVFVMGYFHVSKPAGNAQISANSGLKWAVGVFSYLLAMLSVLVGVEAIRQLVFLHRGGFDFDQMLQLGVSGFLALTGLVVLMVGLFLFSHRLALGVSSARLNYRQRLSAIGLATAVFAVLCFLTVQSKFEPIWIALFGLLYVLALDAFAHWSGGGFGWAISWLVLFSLFSSTQLYRFNDLRDEELRLEYAETLAIERDTAITEPLLNALLAELQKNASEIGYKLKPWPFKAGVEELSTYFERSVFKYNYLFQHYRLSVFAFDKDSQPILLGQNLGYEQVVLGGWATAKPLQGSKNIRFGTDTDGTFRYILQLSTNRMGDDSQPAVVYLFFDRAHPLPSRSFTPLFFNSPLKNLAQLHRYDFSIAKNGRLSVDQGLANMTGLGSTLANGTSAEFESFGRVDAVAKSSDGKTIAAVGRKEGGWLKQVYLFSILFALSALCLLGFAIANTWLRFLPEEYAFRLSSSGSLARRIHFWNVTLLAVSFVVVGYLTYQHFNRSAQETERSSFNYRATALLTNLKNLALNTSIPKDSLALALPRALTSMSASLGMDAQFFDPDGNLAFTTQGELTRLGVLPAKMNPSALDFLKKNPQQAHFEAEQSAGLKYRTLYRSVQNRQNAALGYLAVPYHETKKHSGAEVSDFIGMLASLYVFLLLIAYAVTFLLARSITRPVSMLSEKVQELRLEDKNEPLAYEGDKEDEISQLISQYNNMVQKLEASKTQLVKLEREGAWREMARQVAHDIKNPLTTMKLSMQQLERLSGSPEQAAAYLRKAITRLIEQIDSLAQIASEFSMFANLDIKSKNDVVINEVVESVHDLFSEQRQVNLSLSLPDERFHILGDKNHLIRVFNNLVINAIQAIPSDRQGEIKVSLSRKEGLAVIQISDNGGGIPPEIRERVFEPNFTTKTSGSGLGLAICKKIIEAHDGDIRFETRDDEGTDFFVEIPVVAVG